MVAQWRLKVMNIPNVLQLGDIHYHYFFLSKANNYHRVVQISN